MLIQNFCGISIILKSTENFQFLLLLLSSNFNVLTRITRSNFIPETIIKVEDPKLFSLFSLLQITQTQ